MHEFIEMVTNPSAVEIYEYCLGLFVVGMLAGYGLLRLLERFKLI